jgi:hypothetical protein
VGSPTASSVGSNRRLNDVGAQHAAPLPNPTCGLPDV